MSRLDKLLFKYFFFLGLFGGAVGPLFGVTPDPVDLLLINAIFVAAGEYLGEKL